MVMSMTGFGKAQFSFESHQTTIEIKSLNSKQLEVNLKLPASYRDKEQDIRTLIAREIGRGKVDCYINIENNSSSNIAINQSMLTAYYHELKAMSDELQPNIPVDIFSIAAKMPDVISTVKEEISEEEGTLLLSGITNAISQLVDFRKHEGAVLKSDIMGHISNIAELLQKVEPFEFMRVNQIRERIEKSINDINPSIQIDQNRLEQEMIFYIEKFDISEEKVRLKKHLEYFQTAINDEVSNGKKLGFVAQEIGREVNTIGSKANCFEIQQIVVQMKDELEKIKEQLLNIL
ncbi:MAG: YicC/YloC family endoribonuclease [Bacteroidota bacterium]